MAIACSTRTVGVTGSSGCMGDARVEQNVLVGEDLDLEDVVVVGGRLLRAYKYISCTKTGAGRWHVNSTTCMLAKVYIPGTLLSTRQDTRGARRV